MAQNKIIRTGPVAVTATMANVYSPPTTTGGATSGTAVTNTYVILRHIRVVNTTAAAVSIIAFINTVSATGAAGKEFFAGGVGTTTYTSGGVSVAGGSYIDWYGQVRLDVNEFFVAAASTTGLTIECEGEIGIA